MCSHNPATGPYRGPDKSRWDPILPRW